MIMKRRIDDDSVFGAGETKGCCLWEERGSGKRDGFVHGGLVEEGSEGW